MISAAYIFMAVGLLSFASMGIVHKLGDLCEAQPLGIALYAMISAAGVTFAYTFFFAGAPIQTIPAKAVILAVPFGASAGAALWIFQKGLRYGRIATSWLLINLSAGVPTVLSIIVYHEPLSWKKLLVLLLVAASLVLLWLDRRNQGTED
jgi:hypothetical protein